MRQSKPFSFGERAQPGAPITGTGFAVPGPSRPSSRRDAVERDGAELAVVFGASAIADRRDVIPAGIEAG
jgi:molybdenum cofactor cytidylyltransferase